MGTKHTPAPWEAKGSYVFAGNDCIGIFDTDNASETRMKANAKLSAAAPDMLAAMKEAHSALDRALGDTDISYIETDEELRMEEPLQWAAMRIANAIAKAEGRTDD